MLAEERLLVDDARLMLDPELERDSALELAAGRGRGDQRRTGREAPVMVYLPTELLKTMAEAFRRRSCCFCAWVRATIVIVVL